MRRQIVVRLTPGGRGPSSRRPCGVRGCAGGYYANGRGRNGVVTTALSGAYAAGNEHGARSSSPGSAPMIAELDTLSGALSSVARASARSTNEIVF